MTLGGEGRNPGRPHLLRLAEQAEVPKQEPRPSSRRYRPLWSAGRTSPLRLVSRRSTSRHCGLPARIVRITGQFQILHARVARVEVGLSIWKKAINGKWMGWLRIPDAGAQGSANVFHCTESQNPLPSIGHDREEIGASLGVCAAVIGHLSP